MSDRKVSKEKLSNILFPFAAIIIAIAVIYVKYTPYYADYENTYINSLLKGTYTGFPEHLLFFVSYPLARLLSKIACLFAGSDILGITLAMVNLLVLYDILALTLSRFEHEVHKLLWTVVIMLFFFIFFFKANILVDYRFIGSMAAGAFLFNYLAIGSHKKAGENILGSILALLFMFMSIGFNPAVFRFCLLSLLLCVIYKLLSEAKSLSCKHNCSFLSAMTNLKLGIFLIMPIVSIVIWFFNQHLNQKFYGENNYTLQYTNVWLPALVLPILGVLIDLSFMLLDNRKQHLNISKSTEKRILSVSLSVICFIMAPICIYSCVKFSLRYSFFTKSHETFNQVNDYFKAQPQMLFIVNESDFFQAPDKVFEKDSSLKNFVSYSGFEIDLPHYSSKLAIYGIDNSTQGLINENVSLVSADPKSALEVMNFFTAHNQDIYITEDTILASDTSSLLCYYIEPDSFRGDFQSGQYSSVFLPQYSFQSFTSDCFDMYTGEKTFAVSKNLTIEELIGKLDIALVSCPDMRNVWILLDPFNYDYSSSNNESSMYLDCLNSLIGNYPNAAFHILLNFPSADTWNLAAKESDTICASYINLVKQFSSLPNISFCFPGA